MLCLFIFSWHRLVWQRLAWLAGRVSAEFLTSCSPRALLSTPLSGWLSSLPSLSLSLSSSLSSLIYPLGSFERQPPSLFISGSSSRCPSYFAGWGLEGGVTWHCRSENKMEKKKTTTWSQLRMRRIPKESGFIFRLRDKFSIGRLLFSWLTLKKKNQTRVHVVSAHFSFVTYLRSEEHNVRR